MSAFCVSAATPVEIDGYAKEKAWQGLEPQVLVAQRDTSNCKVCFALVTYFYQEESNSIYLAFKVCLEEGEISDETPHGVMVNVDNSGFVTVSHQGISDYNAFDFAFEGAVSQYNPLDYCVEMRVGIKAGLDTLQSIEVRFVDADDICSNSYFVELESLLPAEETATVTDRTEVEQSYKTTAENTTGITTTRATTVTSTAKTTRTQTVFANTTAMKTEKIKSLATQERISTAAEQTASQKTTKQQASEPASAQTVYVTVSEQIAPVTSVPVTESQSTSTETAYAQKDFKEVISLDYSGVIALVIVSFGICIVVNTRKPKS